MHVVYVECGVHVCNVGCMYVCHVSMRAGNVCKCVMYVFILCVCVCLYVTRAHM